jgi:hypothetical protein
MTVPFSSSASPKIDAVEAAAIDDGTMGIGRQVLIAMDMAGGYIVVSGIDQVSGGDLNIVGHQHGSPVSSHIRAMYCQVGQEEYEGYRRG